MRYCKYLSLEDGASLARYALVEKRNGAFWATLPMQAPQEDLSSRILGGLPVPTTAVDFVPTPLTDLKLLPPVAPSKIICVGRNYKDHAAELGNEVPKEPLLFFKPPSSLLAPKGTVRIPAISTRVDYEGELGIVHRPSLLQDRPRRRRPPLHPRLCHRQRRHRPRHPEVRRPIHPRQGLRHLLPRRPHRLRRDRPRRRSARHRHHPSQRHRQAARLHPRLHLPHRPPPPLHHASHDPRTRRPYPHRNPSRRRSRQARRPHPSRDR